MAPAVEVLFAPATEAFQNDPAVLHPVLDMVLESKGCQGVYYGSAVEDKSQLVAFIVWETLESHHALMNDKEKYPILGGHLAKAADVTKVDMFHVYFEPAANLAKILNAPVTSYVHVQSRKEGKTAEELAGQFDELIALPLLPGGHGGAGGKAVEKDEQVLIFGWDSPEVHHTSAARDEAKQVLVKLRETGDKYKAGHVKFNVYKKYEA